MAQKRFAFDEVALTALLVLALFFALFLAFALVCYRVVAAGTVRVIRTAATGATLRPGLRRGQKFHLFLSHTWATAQDQVATIKRQLQLLAPGVSIFLDVDDLVSIELLEAEVAGSQVRESIKHALAPCFLACSLCHEADCA